MFMPEILKHLNVITDSDKQSDMKNLGFKLNNPEHKWVKQDLLTSSETKCSNCGKDKKLFLNDPKTHGSCGGITTYKVAKDSDLNASYEITKQRYSVNKEGSDA